MKKYLFLLAIFAPSAFASNGLHELDDVFTKIIGALSGNIAYSLAIISIAVCGFVIAFTDLQSGAKRLLQSCCGISLAVFATQIVTNFLGFSGAVIS